MTTRTLLSLLTASLISAAVGAAERSIAPGQLQELLKQFPAADANGDGQLTLDEARTYRQKMTAKGKRTAKPAPSGAARPAPTRANVPYGPHERNVLDLWLAKSDVPTPLVVFIHGGGFVNGDKSAANPDAIRRCLEAGVSFMSINYRFRQHAAIQDILRDAARAIQFVRLHAAEYNLDPQRIASFGGSAGAGTSLWLAVHDDLDDPDNADPVLRQSSRLAAAGCLNGQATYDMTEWERIVGEFKSEWRRSEAEDLQFYRFQSRDDYQSPEGKKILADCSMLGQITKDDPPLVMTCSVPDGEPENRGQLVHHPRHAKAVQQRCQEAGVQCEIHLQDAGGPDRGGANQIVIDFLLGQLRAASEAGK